MTNLDDVTSEELVNELVRRFDAVLFVGKQDRSVEATYCYCRYSPDLINAFGLAAYARNKLMHEQLCGESPYGTHED